VLDALPALTVFGEIEKLIADHLYPYRYPISLVLVVGFAGATYVAVRLGVHEFLWRHRIATAVVGTPLLIVAAVAGDYLVSPLWERSFLEEASPVEAAAAPATSGGVAPGSSAGGTAGAAAAQVRRTGAFKGADSFHFAEGKALLIETAPGKWVLRFEDFSVRSGPDLYVYLGRGGVERVDETLNLGELKATDGAFNYEIPAGIDVATVRNVLVWCRQFAVLFGSAPLEPS
jgi:hypothetical protein